MGGILHRQLKAEAGLITRTWSSKAAFADALEPASILFRFSYYMRALVPHLPFGKGLFGGRGVNGCFSNFRMSMKNFSTTVRRSHGRDSCRSYHGATCKDWSPSSLW